ncbi:MAG: S53 family peptidase, partial [Actinomycetota bacterium]|nr:S53 family peptidase [Actinomycetota bacterium]
VGAEIVAADPVTRLVRVRGTAGVLGGFFGTELRQVPAGARGTRARSGELSVPAEIATAVVAVLGLDDRPQAAFRYRVAAATAASVSYTPLQLAKAYGLPDADGTGQSLAIVELGGGFAQSDLDRYFGALNLTPPTVTAVGVDGGTNQAGNDPNGADGEVLLDIEVAGAIAPAASIAVYFAPNTDAGFLDAITGAAHATPTPTALSISWGQSEDQWTAQARSAMDAACADAALLGVTVTAAAGDTGSTDNQPASAPHRDFPASSPHVLACGGTSLHLAADGTVASETVWNDGGEGGSTGGGVSDAFAVPSWQRAAGIPARSGAGTSGRGVPDVAAVADPATGYRVLVDGSETVIGGTSAVAPLWAGLICRLAQLIGKPLGLLQPALYAGAQPGAAASGLRDITAGSNGAYHAVAGWDACTGLGVPDGAALLIKLHGNGMLS